MTKKKKSIDRKHLDQVKGKTKKEEGGWGAAFVVNIQTK